MKRKILFPVLAFTCFIFAAHPAPTQEKKTARAAEIEAEIDKLENRLIELRAELFQIKKKDINPGVIAQVRQTKLNPAFFKLGQRGEFPHTSSVFHSIFRVTSIINDGEALVQTFPSGSQFILKTSTKKLKEEGIIDLRPAAVYEIVDSKKFGPKAYFVLEKIAD